MISPVTAAQLNLRAYDPGLLAAGTLPDLSSLGFTATRALWGRNCAGAKPFGYMAMSADGSGWQALVGRGTENLGDALSDANIRLVAAPWRGVPGRVHRGFSSLADTFGLGSDMLDILGPIVSLARLILIGHSEGAAALRQLSMKLGRVAGIFTWGEPKSCDRTAATHALTCVGFSRRAFNPHCAVHLVPGIDLLDVIDPYESTNDAFPLPAWGNPLDVQGCHSMVNYVAAEQALAQPKAA